MLLMNRGYFDYEKKPKDPQFEPHAKIKNGAGSGIFAAYLWLESLNPFVKVFLNHLQQYKVDSCSV